MTWVRIAVDDDYPTDEMADLRGIMARRLTRVFPTEPTTTGWEADPNTVKALRDSLAVALRQADHLVDLLPPSTLTI